MRLRCLLFFWGTGILLSIGSGRAASADAPAVTFPKDATAVETTESIWRQADSLLRLVYRGAVEQSRQHHRAFERMLDTLVRANPTPTAYAWNRIEGLSYFKSDDGRLQLLNWSIPNINGTSSYGGLVWVRQQPAEAGQPDAYLYYPLQDFSSYQPYPEALTLSPAQWWGAYYYQAIEHRQGDTLFMTLIGVNHSQSRYAQKVIEVLWLSPNGEIGFGAPIFRREALAESVPPAANADARRNDGRSNAAGNRRMPEANYPNAYIGFKPQGAEDTEEQDAAYAASSLRPNGRHPVPTMRRIVFRYNPRTDMILRYDYQSYRRYRGKKAKETPAYMIVCDRLMNDPLSLDQTAARLVPAGGVYDAYIFHAPYWYPVEDVIARNPNPERAPRHR